MSGAVQVVGQADAALPKQEAQEDSPADAEDGHGETEAGHRSRRVRGAQEAVRTGRRRPRARVARLGRHLQRVPHDVDNLDVERNDMKSRQCSAIKCDVVEIRTKSLS